MKVRRTTLVLLCVFVGYVATWLFAPSFARKACETRAKRLYSEAVVFQADQKKMWSESGRDPSQMRPIVTPGGPHVDIGFAFPVLPGILLLNNSYGIGPLYGRGQVSVFLYYGFGVCRLFEVMTWIS